MPSLKEECDECGKMRILDKQFNACKTCVKKFRKFQTNLIGMASNLLGKDEFNRRINDALKK